MPQLRLKLGESPAEAEILPIRSEDAESSDVRFDKLKPGPGTPAVEVLAHQAERIHRATLELLIERGYAALTMRELARRAGVSTRSLYQHHSSKEKCVVAAHERILENLDDKLIQLMGRYSEGYLSTKCAMERLIGEWRQDQHMARFMLINAYEAGSASFKRSSNANKALEPYLPSIVDLPMVREAVFAGTINVVRMRLYNEQEQTLETLCAELTQWALNSYDAFGHKASRLGELALWQQVRQMKAVGSGPLSAMPSFSKDEVNRDEVLFLAAAMKLVATGDNLKLDRKNIVKVAGVSGRSFDAHFSSVGACLAVALKTKINEVIGQAKQASEREELFSQSVHNAFVSICEDFSRDAALRGLCFGDISSLDGNARLQCHADFMRSMVDIVEGAATFSDAGIDRTFIEASVGAFWGLLESSIHSQEHERLSALPAFTACLLSASMACFNGDIGLSREDKAILKLAKDRKHSIEKLDSSQAI